MTPSPTDLSSPPEAAARVLALGDLAVFRLGSPAAALAFLFTPHPGLQGLEPAVLEWWSDALLARASAALESA